MAVLRIFRGVPGTGKSTAAAKTEGVLLEADMYFFIEDGTYKFDFTKLRWAHEWCLNTAKVLLRNGHDVTVANTFTTWKELRPYIEFAIANNIDYSIQTLTKEYGSIHGVPDDKMVAMRERFQSHAHIMEQVAELEDKLRTS